MAKKALLSKINEDWWAVIIGLLLILLAAIGWLGEKGLKVIF